MPGGIRGAARVLEKFKTKLEPVRLRVAVGDVAAAKADAVGIAGFIGKRKGEVTYDKTRARPVLAHLDKAGDFRAKSGEAALLQTLGKLPAPRLLVLGLGSRSQASAGTLRDYAARAALKFRGK